MYVQWVARIDIADLFAFWQKHWDCIPPIKSMANCEWALTRKWYILSAYVFNVPPQGIGITKTIFNNCFVTSYVRFLCKISFIIFIKLRSHRKDIIYYFYQSGFSKGFFFVRNIHVLYVSAETFSNWGWRWDEKTLVADFHKLITYFFWH